jgi:hypothetical protein
MSVKRRNTGRAEHSLGGPTAATWAVADHWQVSQYVPIRRIGDTDRLATGWMRAGRRLAIHMTRASEGAAEGTSTGRDGGSTLTPARDRQCGAEASPRPPPQPIRSFSLRRSRIEQLFD